MFDSLPAPLDPHGLSDAALLERYERLLALEARVQAEQARVLVALDIRQATVAETGRLTRAWLVEELHLGPAEASRRLLLARGLPVLRATQEALAAGAISAEHALVIVRGTRGMPAEDTGLIEPALADLARDTTPSDLAARVDATRERLGLHESRDAAYARRLGERSVTVDVTFAGFGSLSGTLTPDVAETLRLALDAAGARTGAEDDRTVPQRRHDALGELATFYLANTEVLPPEVGERPRLVVTLDYQALLADLKNTWATLDSGVEISPATARRLACDADLLPAVLGGTGEVLDLGRTTRTPSTAQRRAAAITQRHRCGFPDCRRPIRDLHHITWWSHGGPTSQPNLAWLCSFHHWLTHEGHWTLTRGPDGDLTWTKPDGQRHTRAA